MRNSKTKIILRTNFLLVLFLILSLPGLALHTIRLKGKITSKPLYFKTEHALIIMDYELFLNTFASEYSKTNRYDRERKIIYKEDGKPYRNALKNYLDSLYALTDSVYLDPSHPVHRYDDRKNSFGNFVASDEISRTIMKLIRSGKVKIQETETATAIRKVVIKKRRQRIRLLAVTSEYRIVQDKASGAEIYSQETTPKAYY